MKCTPSFPSPFTREEKGASRSTEAHQAPASARGERHWDAPCQLCLDDTARRLGHKALRCLNVPLVLNFFV